MNRYSYFVSYKMFAGGGGRTVVNTDIPVTGIEDIERFERLIEAQPNREHVVITNFQLIKKENSLKKFDLKILDKRITPEHLKPKTTASAGIDLCACIDEPVVINPGETVMIGSGIALNINNPGYAAHILPRSGLGHKNGIVLGNLVGLIDSDYQGTVNMSVWNRSNEPYEVKPMDRIAQLVIVPVVQPDFNIVDSFDPSERGEGGFGSTGVGHG